MAKITTTSNAALDLEPNGTGDINLTPGTNGDVNIPANKGLTFGNDGEKIEGDGTDLTIASSAVLNVNTGSSSGNDLKVNSTQLVVEGDTGRVGIGLAAPSQQLHISGATPIIQMTDTDTNADSLITASNGTGTLKIQVDNGNESADSTFEVDVDGSQRMKVDSTGDLTITDGDLVIGTAGHGIDFSVNSHESGMTSELLDDYEEGTAQVVFRDSESTPNNCTMATGYGTISYTKIGDTVHCSGDLRVSSKGSTVSSSTLRANGLPFVSRNSDPGKSAVTIGVATNLNMGGADSIRAYIEKNTNDFIFRINDSSNGDTDMAMSAIDANFILLFSLTYKTDS